MAASSSCKAAVFRAIASTRRSCNRFQTNRAIEQDVLRDILKTANRAPSSFNLQPTQIIMVQNAQLKQELSQNAMLGPGNQYRTNDCSALAVFLADLQASKRIARIYQLEQDWGQRHPAYMNIFPLSTAFLLGEGHAATWLKQATTALASYTQTQPMPHIEAMESWAAKNTALVVQSYVLAATSHNLATCVMEGYDDRRVKEILRIPDRYTIPMVVATGYDYDEVVSTADNDNDNQMEHHLTPRLDLEEVVFGDTFGAPFAGEAPSSSQPGDEERLLNGKGGGEEEAATAPSS